MDGAGFPAAAGVAVAKVVAAAVAGVATAGVTSFAIAAAGVAVGEGAMSFEVSNIRLSCTNFLSSIISPQAP